MWRTPFANPTTSSFRKYSLSAHLVVATALILLAQICAVGGQNPQPPDIRLPPYILVNPVTSIMYRPGADKIVLNCSAGGQPAPSYQWFKDGNIVPAGALTSGDLVLNTTAASQGEYRCFATNIWGTTMSSAANLSLAFGDMYSPNEPIGYYAKAVGQPLMLPCKAPNSYPPATYKWAIANGVQDASPRPVITSERIQINPLTGNLHFSNLQPEDQLAAGECYKCVVFNPVLDASTGGAYATIVVNSSTVPPILAPTPAYQSESPQTGLLGGSITLYCFFDGYPTPSQPTWSKEGGTLPSERCSQSQWNSALTILNLQQSDAGAYVCQTLSSASGSATTYSLSITLNIQSKPFFISQPTNVNASNGDTVQFRCATGGDPQPDITWYRNSQPLSTTQLPNKYSLSANFSILTVRSVCKTCPDGSSDLAVIQCTSTNRYGTVLGSGYLNVLVRTTIVAGPGSVPVPSGSVPFSLPCEAVTDPSTPLSITWYVGVERIYNDSSRWYVDPSGTLHVVGSAPQGNYTCVASNGFSSDTEWAWIGAVNLQASGGNWWVFVLISLLILLVCALGLLYYYLRKNRGESYPVEKKELLTGNDPERELRDTGFQEHRRGEIALGGGSQDMLLSGALMSTMMTNSTSSLTNVKKTFDSGDDRPTGTRSGGSISSSLPPVGSEEGDSLSDMSRDRVGRFNDEGSFLPPTIAPIPE